MNTIINKDNKLKTNFLQIRKSGNDFKKNLNNSEQCKVSRASTEIMLDRFSNGRGIDFPF